MSEPVKRYYPFAVAEGIIKWLPLDADEASETEFVCLPRQEHAALEARLAVVEQELHDTKRCKELSNEFHADLALRAGKAEAALKEYQGFYTKQVLANDKLEASLASANETIRQQTERYQQQLKDEESLETELNEVRGLLERLVLYDERLDLGDCDKTIQALQEARTYLDRTKAA